MFYGRNSKHFSQFIPEKMRPKILSHGTPCVYYVLFGSGTFHPQLAKDATLYFSSLPKHNDKRKRNRLSVRPIYGIGQMPFYNRVAICFGYFQINGKLLLGPVDILIGLQESS